MKAKDIIIKPITAQAARDIIRTVHYSGKVVQNSQIHFGVFIGDRCGGAMQFGPPINKKGSINLVKGTKWDELIELNRMAFADWLPKNSESRAIGVALRLIKKNYPHIKWVLSFADATQCGHGTIYQASGFVLTGISKNTALRINPADNTVMHCIQAHHLKITDKFKNWKPVNGYQMRYVYFLHKDEINNLVVPIIPFAKIYELGIGMYKGKRAVSVINSTGGDQLSSGGVNPTTALQAKAALNN